MQCNLEMAICTLRGAYGLHYPSMAKCNFIVNIVTLLEVRLRPQAVSTVADELLEGDLTQKIIYSNVALS